MIMLFLFIEELFFKIMSMFFSVNIFVVRVIFYLKGYNIFFDKFRVYLFVKN